MMVNKGCTNFVIYFFLTYGLSIWLGFFSYRDVTAYFRNLLSLQGFINVSESFSYKNSLFILATTRKEDFKINSTFRSDFLVYLKLLKGENFDSSIFRIVIFGFLLCL